EDVGRIDMVCVNPENESEWCAVEMQAVYFSGGAMSKDFPAIREYEGNDFPMPGVGRRPDFRSSGPKRLMPQLQIKVPTLRRWGKKMAVVIDKAFFDALGDMSHVDDVSNADIVWIIVGFDESAASGTAKLMVRETKFTTLERAVEGLTAGVPTTKAEFEKKLSAKLKRQKSKQ
ncbi:MAG: NotI family restriction endonuclease, partial [Stellaceae bacterium]